MELNVAKLLTDLISMTIAGVIVVSYIFAIIIIYRVFWKRRYEKTWDKDDPNK